MKEPKKILVVRTDRIGDVILSTPVVANLRAAFPKSYIAFMCRPYTAAILEKNPNIDELIIYDKYGKHKSFLSSLAFSFYLRKKKFDLSLVLHPTNRAHLLIFFAGIKRRVGWDRKLGFLLNKRIAHKKQEGKKHELEYTLDILREAGVNIVTQDVFIPKNPADEAWADNLLQENNINYKKDIVIGLGIGASCPSKIWPSRNFAELARKLHNQLGAKIIVFAEGKESNLSVEFKINCTFRFLDLTGKVNLSEIFSLFRRLALFIGNDSGLVHACWGVGRPVISIFGRNNPGLSPRRWGPRGKDSFFFHQDPGCKVCQAHNCQKGFICLKKIAPQDVFQKASYMLDKAK